MALTVQPIEFQSFCSNNAYGNTYADMTMSAEPVPCQVEVIAPGFIRDVLDGGGGGSVSLGAGQWKVGKLKYDLDIRVEIAFCLRDYSSQDEDDPEYGMFRNIPEQVWQEMIQHEMKHARHYSFDWYWRNFFTFRSELRQGCIYRTEDECKASITAKLLDWRDKWDRFRKDQNEHGSTFWAGWRPRSVDPTWPECDLLTSREKEYFFGHK